MARIIANIVVQTVCECRRSRKNQFRVICQRHEPVCIPFGYERQTVYAQIRRSGLLVYPSTGIPIVNENRTDYGGSLDDSYVLRLVADVHARHEQNHCGDLNGIERRT